MGDTGTLWTAWIMAGASLLNLVVLAVYAYFTWGIWGETQRNAHLAEDQARLSRDIFKLQLLDTYSQVRASMAAYEREEEDGPAVVYARFRMLEVLLERAFPEDWTQLTELAQRKAHKKGP